MLWKSTQQKFWEAQTAGGEGSSFARFEHSMKKGLHMAQCKIKRGREKIVHFMLLLQVTEKNTVNLQQVSNVC